MWLKEWRRRYFRLKGNKLYFSKSPHVRLRGFSPRASRGDGIAPVLLAEPGLGALASSANRANTSSQLCLGARLLLASMHGMVCAAGGAARRH